MKKVKLISDVEKFYIIMIPVVLVLNLAFLATSVWVIVVVLRAMGVL